MDQKPVYKEKRGCLTKWFLPLLVLKDFLAFEYRGGVFFHPKPPLKSNFLLKKNTNFGPEMKFCKFLAVYLVLLQFFCSILTNFEFWTKKITNFVIIGLQILYISHKKAKIIFQFFTPKISGLAKFVSKFSKFVVINQKSDSARKFLSLLLTNSLTLLLQGRGHYGPSNQKYSASSMI